MDWLAGTLQQYPEISIVLALAFGYGIGGLKVGPLRLGSVTGTLLVGVLIGQMHVSISASVKATCFLVFLFFVGYGVGPQFFHGLRKHGVPQVAFAAVQCAISLLTGFAVAKVFGYDVGQAVGLLAGSHTVSALLGTGTDAINRLAIPIDEKRRLLDAMTAAYAVTYIFGTAGTAWILSAMGPRLVGGNIMAACKDYEATTTSGRAATPAVSSPRAVSVSAVVFVTAGITLGALFGAMAIRIGEVPLNPSTSGGALAIGLVFGWLRSSYRIFEDIPEPAMATMNSVGLNVFIAMVGINAGPGFVAGLGEAGLSLFLAGILVTAIPLVVGLLLARYVFRFHPGIALGCVAGARTTAPALGAVQEVIQSKVPALGYTVPYAVANTLLAICGIAIVMLMT